MKGEVFGKTLPIPTQLFIQAFRGHAVNARKIRIQHDLLVANRENSDVWGFVFHSTNWTILSFASAYASRHNQSLIDLFAM